MIEVGIATIKERRHPTGFDMANDLRVFDGVDLEIRVTRQRWDRDNR